MTNERLNLPEIDGNRSYTGPQMVAGSLELAKFYQHIVTSIELADKWRKNTPIEANLRPFLSNIGSLQLKTGPAKSTEVF